MNPKVLGGWLAENAPLPDAVLRCGIAARVATTRRRLASLDAMAEETRFMAAMAERPIADLTSAANQQHYELPAAFFENVLGPRRKYSCCLYEAGDESLAEAEEKALRIAAERAILADGQSVLELGSGWGSLCLWMAERFPASRIVAVSNSRSQREFIERQSVRRGFANLRVITADMNNFIPRERFDRIVSVEMFEHMANWPLLLDRIADWLNPDGRLFLHVFTHRSVSYSYNHDNDTDWIAKHFFTGGIMPSHKLIRRCDRRYELDAEWRWSGGHYQRTALNWLANFDQQAVAIRPILSQVYGADAALWRRRWRLFFLATAGLFGDSGGEEWGVSHYRLKPRAG